MPTLAELADAYLAGAGRLQQTVAGMTREQLVARPVPGKWSTLEVLAHIADFEAVFADRMMRVLALDEPPLLAVDDRAFSHHLAYLERDAAEEVALVVALRRKTARVLRNAPASAVDRVGVHSEAGRLTLAQIVTKANDHLGHHLAFVDEKKSAMERQRSGLS